jgi:hypothetical protein
MIQERVRAGLAGAKAEGKILDLLLSLDGERLSYRTLDVEQIGISKMIFINRS